MSLPRALNSRSDDLLLLAKNHYRCSAGLVEGARRIVSFHNLWSFDASIIDTAHVVLNDLLPKILPTLSPDQLTRMLLELGPRPVVGGLVEREGGVYEGLIIMALIAAMRLDARSPDGTVLMTLPEPDAFVAGALLAADPSTMVDANAA